MNFLMESGIVSEKEFDENFICIFNESKDFLITEYKVLQSQNNISFLRCMKLLYNGKLALYYETGTFRTLEELLPSLDSGNFLNLVSNLLRSVIDIKNNGFLSCQNLDISFEKIFINGSNMTVNLVYIPCQNHIHADYAAFETQLRTSLIDVIHRYPALQSPATASLERNLSDHSLSLSSLSGYVRGGEGACSASAHSQSQKGNSAGRVQQQMHLIAMRAPMHFELVIDRDEYIIGKKAGAVHGVISFNSAISRVHCKITRNSFGFRVEDMGSANGTYVNRQKLVAHKPVAIKNGDLIRLANSDFQVLIR